MRVTLHYLMFGDNTATTFQHAAESLVPFGIALTVGLLVSDVSFVFAFVGAIARTFVSFFFPAGMYLRCLMIGPLMWYQRATAYALLGLGSVIMVLGVWSSIVSLE